MTRAFLLMLLVSAAAAAAPSRNAGDPPASGIRELWVVPHDRISPAEQVLAQTLQGLTGRDHPKIWLRTRGMNAIIEEQLHREGVRFHEVSSAWDLLPPFGRLVKGYILYRLRTPSLNVATSLCGALDAVAVDESQQARAEQAGLKLLVDARDMDERQAFGKYRDRFGKGIVVEQAVTKPGHLRDFAIAHRAFTFFSRDSAFRTEAARAFGPEALVFGWGPDEYQSVSDYSRANASCGPADWCVNLSALEKLPAGRLHRPRQPTPEAEDGARYVAFVMSDGDNLQWLTGDFVNHRSFWGSPLRGQFPMTWEVSTLLPKYGPRVLEYLYGTTKSNEGLVAGSGVPGYTFPHLQPDREAMVRQAAPLLRKSDLSVVSVLNTNEGSLRETAPILELPTVDGVIYKAYSPYHRLRGEIYWHRGKPAVSYRCILWERLMEPAQIAAEVAKTPASPKTDERSYTLVNVHAWSYGNVGGPLEGVCRTIALLPPNTHVVTADQIIQMLRANFGLRHKND